MVEVKPFRDYRLLALMLMLILAACSQAGTTREDFGLGVHITDRLEKARDALREVIKFADASVHTSTVRGAFCCTDDEADISVSLQDLNFDGRVDIIRSSSTTYQRSAYTPRGAPESADIRREYEESEYAELVAAFRAKYPGVKTAEGITLGSTYGEIRSAYELEPLSQQQVGMKRRVVYRLGDVHLIFVLVRDRVVEMVLVRSTDFDRVFRGL